MTFEALAPWLATFVVIGILYAIGTKQRRPGHVRLRSDCHEAYLSLMDDILNDADILELMVSRRVATKEALVALRATVGQLPERALRAMAAKLVSDRIVRRAVAKFMVQHHGVNRQRFTMLVSDMVGEVRA